MIVALKIILYFLGLVLIVVMGFLLVPLKYQLKFIYKDDYCITAIVHVGQLYGLNGSFTDQGQQIKLILAGLTFPLNRLNQKIGKTDKKEADKNPATPRPFSVHRLLENFMDKGFIEQMTSKDGLMSRWQGATLHLIRDIFKIIKPQSLYIHGRVGFNEPHYTAWLLAVLGIFQGINVVSSINVEPVWDEEFLEIDLLIAGKIVLGVILWKLIRFFMKTDLRSRLKKTRADPIADK